MRSTWIFAIAVGMIGLARVSPAADESPLATSLAAPDRWTVTLGPKVLLSYVYAPSQMKPYVRELMTMRGDNVVRDSPFDHLHHHGLMFAIRVDDVNFWEETPGAGVQRPVGAPAQGVEAGADGRPTAVFRQRLHWLAPGDDEARPLLIEDRTLRLSVDEGTGAVVLRWRGDFRVGPKAGEVRIHGSNYNGLGVRFPQEFDPMAEVLFDGRAATPGGHAQAVAPAAWAAIRFEMPGRPVTLMMAGRPDNAGGPARFFAMKEPFSYLSATAGLDVAPLTFKAGEAFRFEYLVTVDPAIVDPETLKARAEAFGSSAP
jgi:hypothetical protein